MPHKENNDKSLPVDKVYNIFMKIFFYFGLFGFIPYFFLHVSSSELPLTDFNSFEFFIIFESSTFLVLLIMDVIGMNTSYLDRISRLITLIMVGTGIGAAIYLYILTQDDWTTNINQVVIASSVLLVVFSFLGWFFIRSDRGLSPTKTKPFYNETVWVLLLLGLIYLVDFYVNGFLLLAMAGLFTIYPFAIIIYGKPKVVPHIKSRRLVKKYGRTTFYNYTIDAVKALMIFLTMLVLSYDGTVVLYPIYESSAQHLWIRNLAFVGIWSSIAMSIFTKIQNKFYNLLVFLILFVVGIGEYILVNTFYVHIWWLITFTNGIMLAGIFYFIEQKIYESDNISVMPGSFYILLAIIFITGILLRENPEIDDILENIQFTLSLLGIGYILGYIREGPKQKSLRASI